MGRGGMNDPLLFVRHRLARLVAAEAARHGRNKEAALMAVWRRVRADPALRRVARRDEIVRLLEALERHEGPDAPDAA